MTVLPDSTGRVAIRDGFGGTRFTDPQLESDYHAYSTSQSLGASIFTPWIAALLFAVTAPFDIWFVGDGEITATVELCFGLRAAMVVFLIGLGIVMSSGAARLSSLMLVLGWVLSVAAITTLALLADLAGSAHLTALLSLASLSTISFVPVLTFWQVRFMNLSLIVPYALLIAKHAPGADAGTQAALFFAGLVLLSTVFMGLYAKRSYDIALRAQFLGSLDLAAERDRAELADRAKTDFLAAASHELRTPLNAISGNLQLLAASQHDASDEEAVRDALAASRVMTSMVRDLLEMTGLETRPDRGSTIVEFGALFDRVRSVARTLAARSGLGIDAGGRAGQETWVRMNGDTLEQVLINLLGNAAKFTRSGRIGFRLRLSGERVIFTVFDTGPGMTPDMVSSAFEPFIRGRSDQAEGIEGSGLGLAIVRQRIFQGGGEIRLRSRPGRGTVFRGWLPAIRASAPDDVTRTDVTARPDLTILAIEDDPASFALLRRMLMRRGHRVIGASTGQDAVHQFRRDPPDVVLSDIRLPDVSGVDLLHQLTRIASEMKIDPQFYAVTANVMPDDLEIYDAVGFDGVIHKPFDEGALDAALSWSPSRQQDDHAASSLDTAYRTSMRECLSLLLHAEHEGNLNALASVAHRVRGAALGFADEQTAKSAARLEEALELDLCKETFVEDLKNALEVSGTRGEVR